ncbi:hypothetical protein GCM10027454_23520 [Algoriphagus aestuariicola]
MGIVVPPLKVARSVRPRKGTFMGTFLGADHSDRDIRTKGKVTEVVDGLEEAENYCGNPSNGPV